MLRTPPQRGLESVAWAKTLPRKAVPMVQYLVGPQKPLLDAPYHGNEGRQNAKWGLTSQLGKPLYCFHLPLRFIFIEDTITFARSGTGSGKSSKSNSFDIPITARNKRQVRRDISSFIGLGDTDDVHYSVAIELGNNKVFTVELDTGSSDLWVVSDQCQDHSCNGADVSRYLHSSFVPSGTDVHIQYGDSFTGTFASGPIGFDTASISGIKIARQPFLLVNDTSNGVVQSNVSGILGLGFSRSSLVQQALVNAQPNPIHGSDYFINRTLEDGPLLSRIAMEGTLEAPMFSISLQRDVIDPSGKGLLSIGKLPDGVHNSSLTWVPVRLYTADEGGIQAPSFAPGEVYPFRWELDIDGVFLDGRELSNSKIAADGGVSSTRVSALIDSGNSVLRGPEDVINNILSTLSSSYDPDAPNPVAPVPCKIPHTLAFKIGGRMFPIDPRDLIGQLNPGNVATCRANSLVATDPPGIGALFRWSLGSPFLRSNLVAFYYGNLTVPSQDPPRIGILSNVPANANQLLQDAVNSALSNGGNFLTTLDLAPTAGTVVQATSTVVQAKNATSTVVQATRATSATSSSRFPHSTTVTTVTVMTTVTMMTTVTVMTTVTAIPSSLPYTKSHNMATTSCLEDPLYPVTITLLFGEASITPS